MNKLIDFFGRQGLFSGLILIYTMVVGIYTATVIQKEAFPNVQYDIIVVTTPFPGAAPEEAEKLITSPLEQELKEVTGIKKMTSISAEGRSMVTLQLDPDQTTMEEAKTDVQEVVDGFADLPDGAEDPVVTSAESKNQPIIEVYVAGDMDELEIRKKARFLEDEIERIREVAKVNSFGLRDLEIHVEAIPEKLSRYQISLNDLISAISAQNRSIPGGSFERVSSEDGLKKEFLIRTVGEFETIADIEKTVVRANDLAAGVRVRDVAKVRYALEKNTTLSRSKKGVAINLTVLKKEKADAIALVDNVKSLIDSLKNELGPQIEISYANDLSYFIRRRLKVLSGNLVIGLGLVLIVLSFFFPFKIALLTAIGIPFSFLGTMIFFNAAGISLNLLTMMGLIIVVGMLVDDAIVVVENSMRYIEKGMNSKEAAIKGTQEIWGPITAAVSTTIVVFLPLMFMSGIFGKFVKYLPMGVLSGLALSLFECFFILPHHIGWLLKGVKIGGTSQDGAIKLEATNKNRKKKLYEKVDELWRGKALKFYGVFLERTLRLRYLVVVLSMLLFVGTIGMAAKFMDFVLFPPEGVEIFLVKAEAPVGTTLDQTSKLIEPVEEVLKTLSDEELDTFVTKVGIQQQDPNDPNTKRGSHFAQIVVFLTPEPSRDRIAKEIIEDMREKTGKPPGLESIRFERINPGPPAGKPISIGVTSKEYKDILPAIEDLKAFLKKQEGVTDLADSHVLGKREIKVNVRPDELMAAGLTVTDLGTTVRAAYEGIEATQIKRLDEEVAVRVTWPKEQRNEVDSLKTLKVSNRLGNLIPITSVAKFSEDQGIANYEHEANERQVRVTGDVDTKVTSSLAVNGLVRDYIPELKKKHPKVNFVFGGEDFDTQESLASLVKTFAVALLGVFLILVVTFQSLTQALLVLFLTVPLGIIAVIWTFFIHGWPITFMGCLGVIALAGVIVNNSIVYVSFVNSARKNGVSHRQSLIDAGLMRLRPIVLTTFTTVVGILPTAYGIGGLDKFVVPIALALGWGMAFGSILTTVVFPASLAVLDDMVSFSRRIFKLENREVS